jgi:hypothetical protein
VGEAILEGKNTNMNKTLVYYDAPQYSDNNIWNFLTQQQTYSNVL